MGQRSRGGAVAPKERITLKFGEGQARECARSPAGLRSDDKSSVPPSSKPQAGGLPSSAPEAHPPAAPTAAPPDLESPEAAGHRAVSARGGRRAPPGRQRVWANRTKPAAATKGHHMPPPSQAPPAGAICELGKCAERDAKLVEDLGWEAFVCHHRPRSDFADLANVRHTALPVLKQYRD